VTAALPPDSLRDRIAASLALADVSWGYHCNFSSDPCRDDMTAAYVDAVLAEIAAELAARDAENARLRAELADARNAAFTEAAALMASRNNVLASTSDRGPGHLAADLLLAARTPTR